MADTGPPDGDLVGVLVLVDVFVFVLVLVGVRDVYYTHLTLPTKA